MTCLFVLASSAIFNSQVDLIPQNRPMISKASTHIIIAEATEDLITNEPWSVENYAEGLMDELFTDIDNILDVHRKLPNHTVRKESVSKQTVTIDSPKVALPQKLDKRLSSLKAKQANTLVVTAPSVTAITTRKGQKNISLLGKVLIAGATLLLTIAIALYLIKSRWLNPLISLMNLPIFSSQSTNSAEVNTQPDVEADLVNYMLAALPVIEQEEVNQHQTPVKAGFTGTNFRQTNTLALPRTQSTSANISPSLTLNPPVISGRGEIERIYIPVYQKPQTISPGANSLATITAAKTSFVPFPPKANPESKKLLAAPINPHGLRVAPPRLPVAILPVVRPNLALPATENRPNLALPAYSAQLEGLLELGKKSAALFNIDGVTHHINTGESIGSSGWTLVEVSKGEAIIRRNGEVRSIYPGQKI